MSRFVTLSFCLLLTGSAAPVRAANEERAEPPAPEANFARDVQPLLARRCLACHGPDDAEGGLMLGSRETALAVTDSGEPAILPGDAHGSTLLARITSDSEWDRMPPEGKPLTEDEVDLLRTWIDGGANWEEHWAFESPEALDPPAVAPADAADPAIVRNPIDNFIQAKLDEKGLDPNPPTDPATLLRRLTFDLIGLPPTPEETAAFVADFGPDGDPQAYEKAVDRLLASPRYGEKWGRHWLDLVRYAQTNSFERDGDKPNAWKYRDYVIRSFNEDKPYDRFVLEQLAGDELPADSPEQRAENLTATGFYRLGIWDDEPADPEQAVYDELDDTVRTVSEGVLGLTVGCARCHDHKLDPIPQADYYKMVAVFRDVTPFDTRGRNSGNNQADVTPPEVAEAHRALDVELARWEAKKREIEQRGIAKMSGRDQRATEGDERERRRVLRRELHKHLSDDEMDDYRETREHLEGVRERREALPPRETTLAVAKTYAPGEIPDTFVLSRGSAHGATGDPLEPGVPELFGDDEQFDPAPTADGSAGHRLAFAEWATSPENRLTARVAVNRVWQHHFGRGLVRSSNNFGKLGTPPTHPDLLNWLADRFVAEGWSLKRLHKLIVTSAAYRRGSGPNEPAAAADPLNDLFWRFDPRRLTAEELRDASLAVTGELNLEMYGPSFYPKLSQEVLAGQSKPGEGWGNSPDEERTRRAVYIYVKRSLIDPALADFDFPETDAACEARFNTVQPAQALALLNGDFANDRAVALAERIRDEISAETPDHEGARIARAVALTTSRPATDAAVADGQAFLDRMRTEFDFSDEKAFELWCLVTLNVNSFLYLD